MATAARSQIHAPLPAPPPKTTIPVPPPRTTRTPAAVSRRLAPALRMGATSPANNLPMAVAQRQASSGGQPLAPAVRMALEESFQVGMEGVRVHSDSRAQGAASGLSARAFTHGPNIVLGPGESEMDLGLMAHEAAHVVHQHSAPTIHRYTPGVGDSSDHETHQASAAVVHGASFQVHQRTTPRHKR